MKSLKKYIKEVQGVGPGAGDARGQSADTDSGASAGDVTNPETLKRLNAYLGSISNMEYLLPEHALNRLRTSLMKV